jgi:hypothetical protein
VPRELGFASGRAAREALAAAWSAQSAVARARDRVGWLDAPRSAWLRDVRRHFPHQAEWLEGASRGAALPLAALVRTAAAELARPSQPLIAFEDAGAPRLAAAAPGSAWVRDVHPEGRFRSLELALPALPAPWIGVNEAGLAVAAAAGARPCGGRHAPGALLARDCLERFETVGSALAWCLGRPAAPGGALLFVDATGEVAGVELAEAGRRVRRPERGGLVLGGDAARAQAIAKRLANAESALGAIADALGCAAPDFALADARARRLTWGELERELA